MAADGVQNPVRELVDGERIVMFFDGSKTRDATAAVGCCMEDGYVFTIGVWEPVDEVPVNAEEIDNRIIAAFDRFDVVGFFADVKEWEGFTKTTWPERWADELKMWAMAGGKMPEPIAWDMRSHSREFALAAELVETEIKEQHVRPRRQSRRRPAHGQRAQVRNPLERRHFGEEGNTEQPQQDRRLRVRDRRPHGLPAGVGRHRNPKSPVKRSR